MLSDHNFLRADSVRLAAVDLADLDIASRHDEDAGFWRLLSADPVYPVDPDKKREQFKKLLKAENAFHFSIRLISDDSFIGTVSLHSIEWSNGNSELGMGIGSRDDWGRGYGAEALAIILKHGFDELNLHRVSLGVFEYNARAIALYESAGFIREAVLRERVRRDGAWFDEYKYGLLRREWEARRG